MAGFKMFRFKLNFYLLFEYLSIIKQLNEYTYCIQLWEFERKVPMVHFNEYFPYQLMENTDPGGM